MQPRLPLHSAAAQPTAQGEAGYALVFFPCSVRAPQYGRWAYNIEKHYGICA